MRPFCVPYGVMSSLLGARLRGNRTFAGLWPAVAILDFGGQFGFLAIPTIAILNLHVGAVAVGGLAAASLFPYLLFSMLAGTIADRARNQKALLLGCLFCSMLSMASIPVASSLHMLTYVQLLLVGFLTTSLGLLGDVTIYSFLPTAVGREALLDANRRIETTRQIALLAGPGVAGILIQAVGAPLAVTVDASSFLVAVAILLMTPIPRRDEVRHETESFMTTLREGAVFVFGDRKLRRCALASANSNLGGRTAMAIQLLFLYRSVHMTPGEIGLITTFTGIAGPLLAFNTGWVTRRIGLGATLGISALFLGAGFAGLPLALYLPPLPVVTACYLFMAIENGLWNVSMITLRQTFTPDEMFGRMVASTRTVAQGTQPIGSILGGILGATIGLVPTLAAGGAIVMATGLYLRIPELWNEGKDSKVSVTAEAIAPDLEPEGDRLSQV